MQTSARRVAVILSAALIGGAAAVGTQQAFAAIGAQGVSQTIQADLGAKRVVVKRSTGPSYFQADQSFHQLTTQKITVPSGQKGLVIARFSGSTYCTSNIGSCSMRMFIDGNRMLPGHDTYGMYILASNDWASTGMEASYGGLGPGEHQVKIEFYSADGMGVTNWSLSLEYWRQS